MCALLRLVGNCLEQSEYTFAVCFILVNPKMIFIVFLIRNKNSNTFTQSSVKGVYDLRFGFWLWLLWSSSAIIFIGDLWRYRHRLLRLVAVLPALIRGTCSFARKRFLRLAGFAVARHSFPRMTGDMGYLDPDTVLFDFTF